MNAQNTTSPTIRPTDPVVDEIVRQVVAHVRPLRVILFGSRAAGTARPDSDVDLLVVMPDGTERRPVLRQLYGDIHHPHVGVDYVLATPEILERHANTIGLVYSSILRTGVEVYAA